MFHVEKNDTVYCTKMDSPNQGAFGLSTSGTSFADGKIEIDASGLGITYSGTLANDSIAGTFKQGGLTLPLTLKKGETPQLNRPQEPKPPYPYISENVTFENKPAEITLAGTLTLPDSTGTFPAVVLIAGSGPNDRDETVMGHKPFLVLADFLTRNGFAVLRYDKRGIGQSKGDYANAITDDFASDAEAAAVFLRSQTHIDAKRIALVGHSEGGIIAPMVAAKNNTIAAVVLMAGMGVKGAELMVEQNKAMMESQRIEPETIARILPELKKIFESLAAWKATENNRTALQSDLTSVWDKMPVMWQLKNKKEQYVRSSYHAMTSPWYRNFMALNPAVYLEKVKCPVFALNGEKDQQVNAAQNLHAIEESLNKSGNKHYSVKTYPQLNHLFQECETGSVDEYVKIEQTLSPEALSDILDWLKKTFATK